MTSWQRIPLLQPAPHLRFSSAQRQPHPDFPRGNKDFNNFIATCGALPELPFQQLERTSEACGPGEHGYLIAAVDGPGAVARIWLTTTFGFDGERLVLVADGEPQTASLYQWATGGADEPLVGWRSGAVVSYRPIAFRERLRVFLDGLSRLKLYYYQLDVRRGEAAAASGGEAGGAQLARLMSRDAPPPLAALPAQRSALAAAAGTTTELVHLDGPRTLQALQLTLSPVSWDQLAQIALQVTWDDAATAAIDAPLADLFGQQLGPRPLDSLPLAARWSDDRTEVSLRLALPMPFATAATVRLANHSASEVLVGLELRDAAGVPTGSWGYLHVQRQQTRPSAADAAGWHPLLDARGSGKLVGTVMTLVGADLSAGDVTPLAFLEGDEVMLIDGEHELAGTGTEDYFNGGFYFTDGPYQAPFSGVTTLRQPRPHEGAALTAYRWHLLLDEIPFTSSISCSLELADSRPELVASYSSAAYFYLDRPQGISAR